MLKIVPLGGLGEIGLNMMAIEFEQSMLIVDAGLMFPDDYMLGVDWVIPDFQYLKENKDRIKALILTHGHEDHIGAVPFFLNEFSVPVFGTRFTLALLKEKLKEHRLPDPVDLRVITAGDVTEFGPFKVEYIAVNHSIVGGLGLAVETPEGIIIHSGDFKIDPTPVNGEPTDLNRFAHFGERGVLVFFSDSTNAEKEGFTLSEKDVRKTLADLIQTCRGRVIVASFASHIARIQQVIDLAVEFNRKLVFNGRSMRTNVRIAREQGFITMPEDVEITEKQIDRFSDENIAIITTGSQGEPMSALTRMAQGKHKNVKIKRGDTIILSSRFIPGNERAITSIINSLYRMGADVVYEKVSDIHTSGHARREELKLMLNLVKPKYFVPIHGEYRHLVRHAKLALDMGLPESNVLIVEDGTVIRFEDQTATLGEPVAIGRILVDGKGVGDVGETVLRDRRRLSGHGMVIIFLIVDKKTGDIVYGPDIISRGFVPGDQGAAILEDAKGLTLDVIAERGESPPIEWSEMESAIKKRVRRLFYKTIDRSPLVLPIIISF